MSQQFGGRLGKLFKRRPENGTAMLLLPFGLAIAYEKLSQGICHAHMLEQPSNLPLIGEIVMMPRFIEAHNALPTERTSRQRQFATFRDSLANVAGFLQLSHAEQCRKSTVSVLSAVASEGKSSLATQLAVCLAMRRNRTILIETDFRAPDVDKKLGLTMSSAGISSVLVGKVTLADAIVKSVGRASLDVLAVGKKTVASIADVCLICTMEGYSRATQLRAAESRLQQIGASPIGVDLNGVSTSGDYYRYGDYPST